MDNKTSLSKGYSKFAARKNKRQRQPEEIVFDKDKRQEYLTGFHKRKLEKKKHAAALREKRANEERLQARKESREAAQCQLEESLRQRDDIAQQESETDNEAPGNEQVQEFDDALESTVLITDMEGANEQTNKTRPTAAKRPSDLSAADHRSKSDIHKKRKHGRADSTRHKQKTGK